MNSDLGWDCHQTLVKLTEHNRSKLIHVWVPGHEGIVQNKQKPVKVGGTTTYMTLSPKRAPLENGTDIPIREGA
jgi:hypothetical protein